MSIGILYERPETDEMGIKQTAEELGIKLAHIPFRKVAIRFGKGGYSFKSKDKDYSPLVENVRVVLNRAQSKNRRLLAANVLEAIDKHVINPSFIEYICYSKLRTLLHLWREGIKTPPTVYVPCDPHEATMDGSEIQNEKDIADLIQREFNGKGIVIKPDAGTHGKNVKLAEGRTDLLKILEEINPSIINPVGVIAQEFIEKWFYDLRIIVFKENGKTPHCHPIALARSGFKDFRTNTFLGNMVFGVKLPVEVRDTAIKCGKAIGKNGRAWLLALDAMVEVGDDKFCDEAYIKSEFEKLEGSFNNIKKVKSEKSKNRDFSIWNKKLEEAFQNYRNHESYWSIKEIIETSLERNKQKILFHEANACPEFWEQTRLIAGINLALPLLRCAQSIIDSCGEE
jgi:glutathione synthase/RimK-type ligase-like ATP-grasp enzyme